MFLLILAWSPWLQAEKIKKKVLQNPNFITQHQKLDLKPDIYVTWLPFGRWVTTIEGGWFVTFWGSVLG